MQAKRFTPDATRLCPRVRWNEKTETPSFHWEIVKRRNIPWTADSNPVSSTGKGHYYQAWAGKKGQRRKVKSYLYSEHVKILEKTKCISANAIKGEPAWAQEMVQANERVLRQLRTMSETLVKIVRSTKQLKHCSQGIAREVLQK